MIPKNITREHVIKAIGEIETSGFPTARTSRKFLLKYNGMYYPPKFVLSIANKYANGRKLTPDDLGGGRETNGFLQRLRFEIECKTRGEKISYAGPMRKEREIPVRKGHSERCGECKETIKKLLEKIYGKVEKEKGLGVGTLPEYFKDTVYYGNLKEIYMALQKHRGFNEFVKDEKLRPADLFVENPGFIFEYDESQHFTQPRKIALEHYPESLELGFDKKRWIGLCDKINNKDNTPPYRDEQRAWYETIRDFLPAIRGFKPTVRVLMKDFQWCSLNPDNPSDVEKFKTLMKGEASGWAVEVREDANSYIGRIILAVRRDWEGSLEEAKSVLEAVYKHWPKDKKVKFLMTCGGFVQFQWPKNLTMKDIGDNKNPDDEAVETLVKEAEKCARKLLDGGLREKLRTVTDYVTLGIDSYKSKISTTRNIITQPHIEIVFLVDLRTEDFCWTGKSYPTPGQQEGLVRIADLNKHFFDLKDVGKAAVLGCHDLSMFNNRNWENTGAWRRKIKTGFRNLTHAEKPVLVLHHPHTTVKVTTWRNAWNKVKDTLQTVEHYAGAGRYYESDTPIKDFDPLKDVLATTKRTNSIDFVIRE